jgi:hypothetical protein
LSCQGKTVKANRALFHCVATCEARLKGSVKIPQLALRAARAIIVVIVVAITAASLAARRVTPVTWRTVPLARWAACTRATGRAFGRADATRLRSVGPVRRA